MLVPATFLTAPVLDAILNSTAIWFEVWCYSNFLYDSLTERLYAYVVVATMAA